MDDRKTAIERAFDLAKSGKASSVTEIIVSGTATAPTKSRVIR
jgi:hypothetical protein